MASLEKALGRLGEALLIVGCLQATAAPNPVSSAARLFSFLKPPGLTYIAGPTSSFPHASQPSEETRHESLVVPPPHACSAGRFQHWQEGERRSDAHPEHHPYGIPHYLAEAFHHQYLPGPASPPLQTLTSEYQGRGSPALILSHILVNVVKSIQSPF
jgi:hypothetical protein